MIAARVKRSPVRGLPDDGFPVQADDAVVHPGAQDPPPGAPLDTDVDPGEEGPPRSAAVRWVKDHPGLVDAIVATVLVVLGIGSLFDSSDAGTHGHPSGWMIGLAVLASAPVAARRRRPLVVLLLLLGAQLALQVQDIDGPGWLAVLIASFTFTTGRSAMTRGRIVALFVASLATIVVAQGILGDAPWRVLPGAVVLAVVMIIGDRTRRRRQLVHDHRIRIAERHRSAARRQLDDERTRLARELHDVVAHSVSVMVIQAAAARRQLAADPDRATSALIAVEDTGRAAMQEMRRVLGVLRSDAPSGLLAPQPSLAALADLVRDAADLPIELTVDADLDVPDVPQAVEVSAYRVVQEALTNVRRHAGRVDRVDVNVRVGARGRRSELVVEVLDDGRGASVLPGAPGFGLIGMRERTLMFAGVLTAGPRTGGGWQVRATFPYDAP